MGSRTEIRTIRFHRRPPGNERTSPSKNCTPKGGIWPAFTGRTLERPFYWFSLQNLFEGKFICAIQIFFSANPQFTLLWGWAWLKYNFDVWFYTEYAKKLFAGFLCNAATTALLNALHCFSSDLAFLKCILKEIGYYPKSVLDKKSELLNVGLIRRWPEPFSIIPIISDFQKYNLNRLTPYHWQPSFFQFCVITKGMILQNFLQTKNRNVQIKKVIYYRLKPIV